jgi:hypothetical protein
MADDMPIAKVKALRDCGRDEYWLQDRIYENPSILGLGDLDRVNKEKRQSSGGRLDILLRNSDTQGMFEVEVMLGETDESHIVRTIEYWDLEKRRWPKRQHTAVLVAERITSRFYNIINLLSYNMPIIGMQVNAIEINGSLGLHFTKIIDSYEELEIETDEAQSEIDGAYWQKTYPASFSFAKRYETYLTNLFSEVALRFLPNYMALTICGIDRIWISGRRNDKSQIEFRLEDSKVDAIANLLDEKKISFGRNEGYLKLTTDEESFPPEAEVPKQMIDALYERNLRRK